MDVSVLNLVAPDKAQVNKDLIHFVLPKKPDFIGQPPQKNTPPPFTLYSTTVPSLAGLHPSPFRGLFNNLSYNPIFGDQQPISGPELWEGAPLERSTDGYEPQSNPETFNLNQTSEEPESPLSCVSTYILLPQSDAR